MNAPTPLAAVQPTIVMVAIGNLVPSKTHIQELRRQRFDPKLIGELAESIKAVGVLQAILVRPLGKKMEIVAGERRYLAAKLAGLADIPATPRELTDDQVLEVQLIENLQREGLHELEEAEGYEELMKLKKISADAVADMVGRSRSYVFKRTKLLALCPEARKAFYAGELDASRALLIARIGHHDTQRAALKDVTKGEYGRGPMSYREALDYIQREYMLRLKDAPFDLEDVDLVPKAGTCQACPKRTGNQQELFGDVKSGDVCTDPKCFDDKRQAHFSANRKKLEAAGKKVIYGDAAKKVLPNWQETRGSDLHRNHLQGGYVPLDEVSYASGSRGRKVADLLGADYEPVLIQHPGSGKIIEVATQQAVAKASQKPGSKSAPTRAAKKPAKPAGPDVDEALRARLIKLIHEKAPKEIGKGQLQILVGRLLSHLNVRQEELADVAAQWGWDRKAFASGGYHSTRKLPKPAMALDVRGLLLLSIEITFLADRYQRKPLLDLFDIDEAKTRELIIQERKAAAKAAREAKKGKAKPASKASGKAPVSNRSRIRAERKAASSNGDYMKPHRSSIALADIIGEKPMNRAEVTKKIWLYIKKHGLQDKKNRRMINADEKLKFVFGGKAQVSMFDMTKMVNKHLTLDKASGTKRPKAV